MAVRGEQGESCVHMMRAAGKCAQHAFGIGAICGLFEGMAVDLDGRVGAENEGSGMQRVNCLRLFERQPLHIGSGLFRCAARLVDVCREDLEGESDLREEFSAPG